MHVAAAISATVSFGGTINYIGNKGTSCLNLFVVQQNRAFGARMSIKCRERCPCDSGSRAIGACEEGADNDESGGRRENRNEGLGQARRHTLVGSSHHSWLAVGAVKQ